MKKIILTAAILSTVAFSSYTQQNAQTQYHATVIANKAVLTHTAFESNITAPIVIGKSDLGQADGNP
jgi:hypothetical protein